MLARDPDIPCEAVVAHEPDVSRSRGRLRARAIPCRGPFRPLSADVRKRVDGIKRAVRPEIALAELRELRRQPDPARRDLGTSRPNVGRIEKELDVRLSTLERYVEALGGKLEIHAVFDDADIKLTA
jgi:hypothetical protein